MPVLCVNINIFYIAGIGASTGVVFYKKVYSITIRVYNNKIFAHTVYVVVSRFVDNFFHHTRSGVLKEQYEACRAEVNRADEEAQFSYQKKKGVAAERKEAKFEKEEAEKYTRLKEELVRITVFSPSTSS